LKNNFKNVTLSSSKGLFTVAIPSYFDGLNMTFICFSKLSNTFGNDCEAGARRGLQNRCPGVSRELGSIPRRSRKPKSPVSAYILTFTDDNLPKHK